MEEDRQNPHKRRVRYSGTHPTRFSEKYKEHDPEKYRDVVEKVIRKGSTPAGMHLPICVEEILAILRIRPGQRGLDATLGYGGHSRRMLESLAELTEAGRHQMEKHIGPVAGLYADIIKYINLLTHKIAYDRGADYYA